MKAPKELYLPKEYAKNKILPVGVTTKAIFDGDVKYIRADLAELTWEDISLLNKILMDLFLEGFETASIEQDKIRCEEALHRFNKQKEK